MYLPLGLIHNRNNTISWEVTTGVNLPEIYQHLRKACCLHFQGVRRLYLSTMSHRGRELKYQILCTSS
jgi:hypothetical protein